MTVVSLPDLRGAKAIAEVLERIWRVPVSASDVYEFLRLKSEPLPCIRKRREGSRKGKLYAISAEVELWAVNKFSLVRSRCH